MDSSEGTYVSGLADSLAMAEAAMRVKTQALDLLMGEVQSMQALNNYLAGVGTPQGVRMASDRKSPCDRS